LTEEEKQILDDNHVIVEINDTDQQESNINIISVHLSGLVSINAKIEKGNSDDNTDRRKSSAAITKGTTFAQNIVETSKKLIQKDHSIKNKYPIDDNDKDVQDQ